MYEVYYNGTLHYTGSYTNAVAAANAGMARGSSVWLLRKGRMPR